MSRFCLLDLGEELDDRTLPVLAGAAAPVLLRPLEPAPPFGDAHLLHVVPEPAPAPPAPRDLVLCRAGADFRLLARRAAPGAATVLARVVAVERGAARVGLARGAGRWLRGRWLARAVDALEVLDRLRHPLTPPLWEASAESCLAGVRAKYGRAAEVREYARTAAAGLDDLERELAERHLPRGGRVLDVGCGAGREALALARAGYRVVAIDVAPAMVAAARRRAEAEGVDVALRVQSVTELDDPPGSYDGAYFAASLHHVPGRARRVDALARIARALRPDGVLVLMVVYRGRLGLVSRTRLVDGLRRAARALGLAGVAEPGDGCMRDVSDASDPRAAIYFHEYRGPGEIRGEIEAAGFVAEEAREGWWVCRLATPSPRPRWPAELNHL